MLILGQISQRLNQLSISVQLPSSDVNYNSTYCSMATFSYSQNICGVQIPGLCLMEASLAFCNCRSNQQFYFVLLGLKIGH